MKRKQAYLILISVFSSALLCVSLRASATTTLRASIEDALLWLCQCCPRHPVRADHNYRSQLVKAFDAASLDVDLDVGLLISIAYHESAFKSNARGRIGEVGIMQTHGLALIGQDVSTIDGQIKAGARWLRRCVDECGGSIERGIALYASGYTCEPDAAPGIRRVVASRVRLWREIDRLALGR